MKPAKIWGHVEALCIYIYSDEFRGRLQHAGCIQDCYVAGIASASEISELDHIGKAMSDLEETGLEFLAGLEGRSTVDPKMPPDVMLLKPHLACSEEQACSWTNVLYAGHLAA